MRREIIGNATLYLGDCREILPTLGQFDAAVYDPPYGIGEAAGKNASRSRPRGGNPKAQKGKLIVAKDFGNDDWDDRPLDQETLSIIDAAARWQIMFGGNYYHRPPSACWLVWDKMNGASDFADCELAWTNLPGAVRRLQYLWNGVCKAPGETRGDHPTQKPVGVMKWALQRLPASARTVIDPCMGSGTTGVAAVQLGLSFTGIEQREQYFDAACRRIEASERQPSLFNDSPPPIGQEPLL